MTINVGPGRSGWQPVSEDDLSAAIADELLQESHYLDVKRSTGDTAGEKKETARDLASFAIDGGSLLVGIGENKVDRRFYLDPQDLSGALEKIENIAALKVDPPLTVVPREIPSVAQNGRGYLVVDVPPSPKAPHMVDGKYYGRGERTRISLSDPEVRRLHARRETDSKFAARLLDEEIQRDPVDPGKRRLGHLYLVAQPVTGSSQMARAYVRRSNATELAKLARSFEENLATDISQFNPSLTLLSEACSRANGMSLSSYVMAGPGRTIVDYDRSDFEKRILDVEFREDGGIRVLIGALTVNLPNAWGGSEKLVVVDSVAVAYARRIVHWAGAIGDQVGYHGSWLFGIHGDRLRGLQSHIFNRSITFEDGPHYDVNIYRQHTTATRLEIEQRPRAVAERLVGSLLEGLGSWDRFQTELTDPGSDASKEQASN